MITIKGTKGNDKDLIIFVELYTDAETFYFSSLPVSISGKTFIQAISKGSLTSIEKNFNISCGGNIGTVSSFDLAIARYNNELDVIDIAPSTIGIQLENRLVRVGFSWVGITDYANINWINDFIIVDYSYNSDTIIISCIDIVEEKYTELPKFTIQKDLDDGFSYFPKAPENILGQTIPIVYGVFDYESGIDKSEVIGDMRNNDHVTAPEKTPKIKIYPIETYKYIASQDIIKFTKRKYRYKNTLVTPATLDANVELTPHITVLSWNNGIETFERLYSIRKILGTEDEYEILGSDSGNSTITINDNDPDYTDLENTEKVYSDFDGAFKSVAYSQSVVTSTSLSSYNYINIPDRYFSNIANTFQTFIFSDAIAEQIETRSLCFSLSAPCNFEIDDLTQIRVIVEGIVNTKEGATDVPLQTGFFDGSGGIILASRHDEVMPAIGNTFHFLYATKCGNAGIANAQDVAEACFFIGFKSYTGYQKMNITITNVSISFIRCVAAGVQSDIYKQSTFEKKDKWYGKAIQLNSQIGASIAMKVAPAPLALIAVGSSMMVTTMLEDWGLIGKTERTDKDIVDSSTVNFLNNSNFFIACKGKLTDGNFI